MKTKETITTILGDGALTKPLGSHAFLDEFALAYHCAVSERLRAAPEAVLERAHRNLNRWMAMRSRRGSVHLCKEWREILDEADVDHLIEILTDLSEDGQRLRSSSPFVGTLPPEEQLEILATRNP